MARMSQIPSLDNLSALAGNRRRGFSIYPAPGAEPLPVASRSRFAAVTSSVAYPPGGSVLNSVTGTNAGTYSLSQVIALTNINVGAGGFNYGGTSSVTPVPEPSTMAIAGLGRAGHDRLRHPPSQGHLSPTRQPHGSNEPVTFSGQPVSPRRQPPARVSIFPAPGAKPLPVASRSEFVLGLSGKASTSGRYFRKATKRPFYFNLPS